MNFCFAGYTPTNRVPVEIFIINPYKHVDYETISY